MAQKNRCSTFELHPRKKAGFINGIKIVKMCYVILMFFELLLVTPASIHHKTVYYQDASIVARRATG